MKSNRRANPSSIWLKFFVINFILVAFAPVAMFVRPPHTKMFVRPPHTKMAYILTPALQARIGGETCSPSLARKRWNHIMSSSTFSTQQQSDAKSKATLPPELFSFAPMMKHTHRNFRYLFRLLSSNAWLYSEMVAADAVVENLISRES